MSTVKTTYIQHPSADEPSIELQADGNVVVLKGTIEPKISPFFLMGV